LQWLLAAQQIGVFLAVKDATKSCAFIEHTNLALGLE
jgi:hypothetical protein